MKSFLVGRWGFRARILALVVLPVIVVTFLLSAYNISTAIDRATIELIKRNEGVLSFIAETSQLFVYAGDKASLDNVGVAVAKDTDVLGVVFFDADKKIISRTGAEYFNDVESLSFVDDNNYSNDKYLFFTKAIRQGDDLFDFSSEYNVGALESDLLGWVMAVVDLSESKNYRDEILFNNLIIFVLIIIITLWMAFRFSRGVVDPIVNLTQAVDHYADDNYDFRVAEVSSTELGLLEKGINRLAERISQNQYWLKKEVEKSTRRLAKTVSKLEEQNVELAEARDDAFESSRAKDDFLARMSHELRTPLTGIMGFVGLLEKADHSDTRKEYTDLIMKSSAELLSTINDILDFSKLRSNSFVLNPVSFNLEDCLGEVLDMHRVHAFENSVELNLLNDSDVPELILADVNKIKKVVSNLVSNAIKFTHCGDVIVFVSRLELDDAKQRILISVKDSGEGIGSDSILRLFDPFYQAEEYSTRRHGGTGLGLAIVDEFVDLMGGEVSISSEVGEGTEVDFSFCYEICSAASSVIDEDSGRSYVAFSPNPWTRRSWRNQLLKRSSNVIVPSTYEGLIDLLKSAVKLDALLIGFDVSDKNKIEIDSILASVRVVYKGNIIFAATDASAEDIKVLSDKYSPFQIVNKPLINSRLTQALQTFGKDVTRPLKPVGQRGLAQIESRQERQLLSGLRLLVAEDNGYNQILLERLLQSYDAVVTLVSDGKGALQLSQKERFDILLFDLYMPEMTGLQLSNAIRNTENINVDTPIIILTADVISKPEASVLAAGANDIAYKPIDEKVLIEKIIRLSGVVAAPLIAEGRPLISATSEQTEEELERLFGVIDSALKLKNFESLKQLTHQLVGVAAVLRIDAIKDLTRELNKSVCVEEIEPAMAFFAQILLQWSKLKVKS